MYNCNFFDIDINLTCDKQLISAYNVTTDKTYNYMVTADDVTFYPPNTWCLIVATIGNMQFNTYENKNIPLACGQSLYIKFDKIKSYASATDRLEYHFFNFLDSDIKFLDDYIIYNTTPEKQLLNAIMRAGALNKHAQLINCLFESIKYITSDNITLQKSTLNLEPSEYIRQKMYFNPTNKEIADSCKISQRTLNNLFKSHYNTTPQNYLLKLKMEKAMQLLETTCVSISEIAYMLSFNSPFHFSNRFKQYCAKSPTQYRAQFLPKN